MCAQCSTLSTQRTLLALYSLFDSKGIRRYLSHANHLCHRRHWRHRKFWSSYHSFRSVRSAYSRLDSTRLASSVLYVFYVGRSHICLYICEYVCVCEAEDLLCGWTTIRRPLPLQWRLRSSPPKRWGAFTGSGLWRNLIGELNCSSMKGLHNCSGRTRAASGCWSEDSDCYWWLDSSCDATENVLRGSVGSTKADWKCTSAPEKFGYKNAMSTRKWTTLELCASTLSERNRRQRNQ